MDEPARLSISTNDLFEFAYIPAWTEQLYTLAQMAAPEPWRYIKPTFEARNTETPILEYYIKGVFLTQAINYRNAATQEEADKIFYIRNQIACLHTGLYTPQWRPIYMVFDRNRRKDTLREFYFRGFMDEKKDVLRHVPLPEHPMFGQRANMPAYDTARPLRLDTDHMLTPGHIERLPPEIRGYWNLPLLLETAAELARRMARADPAIAVPQVYRGRIGYLLPMYLSRPDRPDVALAVDTQNSIYLGSTCLTMEMAYQNARLLTRPSAGWLRRLVEAPPGRKG